jgi:hypothetical protein
MLFSSGSRFHFRTSFVFREKYRNLLVEESRRWLTSDERWVARACCCSVDPEFTEHGQRPEPRQSTVRLHRLEDWWCKISCWSSGQRGQQTFLVQVSSMHFGFCIVHRASCIVDTFVRLNLSLVRVELWITAQYRGVYCCFWTAHWSVFALCFPNSEYFYIINHNSSQWIVHSE